MTPGSATRAPFVSGNVRLGQRAQPAVACCLPAVQDMIIFHGTTVDCLAAIRREGVCVMDLGVRDSAVVEVQSWWWTGDQLQLPVGCPPSCIVSVDDSDPR